MRRLIALVLVMVLLQTAAAHETDQFTLPLGREFADLRVHISGVIRDAIAEAVESTNASIRSSLRSGRPTPETERLQGADTIAGNVWGEIFLIITTNEGLDTRLHSDAMAARYPGLVTAYRAERGIYDHPILVLDITKWVRVFFRASTAMVDGTEFGTDKIIHFLNLGRIYHSSYVDDLDTGMDEAQATLAAVELSSGSNLFLSESALLGIVSTGIRSNGDLAADYAGLLFFRNLTEELRIDGRRVPPMLIRDGPYWRLADHVNPYSDFFIRFITPHWNEVLNPNDYAFGTGSWVRDMMAERCPDLLDWYRDERGRVRDRRGFEEVAKQLSTFYGEDYGHEEQEEEESISVATTCFTSPTGDARAPGNSDGDAGRTGLWWAVKAGDREQVKRLLAAGAEPNGKDVDGETPLHWAARWGRTDIAGMLLEHGAESGTNALYGTTPLHLAARNLRSGVARSLLTKGADPNARDAFGQSPLHESALRGDRTLAALLLAWGADANLASASDNTPLHLAARSGDEAMAQLLLGHGASPQRRNQKGHTPADEARWSGRETLARRLAGGDRE